MKILVTTDFSANARTALDYAARLAIDLNASLTIAHIIRPLSSSGTLLCVEKKELEKNVVFELHELQTYLMDNYGLKTMIKVGIGDIAEGITRLAQLHHMNLIVMGTQGATGLKKMLFGSNTADVIDIASVPVLALPPEAKYRKPSRIVFATEYQTGDIEDIEEVAHFAELFNASVSAVHVVNRFTDEDLDFDIHLNDYFNDLVHRKISYNKINCEEFQHTDVAEGIRCFLETGEADILALSRTHRNMLEKLFTKSITREFLFTIDTPLLVFQSRKSE